MDEFLSVYPDSPAGVLEAAFRSVLDARMAGLPILHAGLQVEAVGFERWNAWWLGVLVTPWCMNLVLVAADPHARALAGDADSVPIELPSGRSAFQSAHVDGLGGYLSCGLFSPMSAFPDQAAARAAAQAALAAVRTAGPVAPVPPAPAVAPARSPVAQLEEQAARPMTKRDFLFGRFRGK